MVSLLQLPQDIWRETIVFFFSKVEDLVRLDSAVVKKSDRTVFLANISGCKRFYKFQHEKRSMRWFVSRNIIVEEATFSFELTHEDKLQLQKLLEPVSSIDFLKHSLPPMAGVQLLADLICSKKLLYLSFSGCTTKDWSALSVCANLTYLKLEDCPHASTGSFEAGIEGCVQLSCFSVSNCAILRGKALVALLKHCVKLTGLYLRGVFDFDTVFAEITQPTIIKTFMCTDEVSKLTGVVLRSIAKVMPRLESFDVQFPHNTVTDDDVEVLVTSCDGLTCIQLFNYAHITNTVFSNITQCLLRMVFVSIDYCWSVTDAGVIALAQAAPNLLSLHLTQLSVTDVALQAVGTHCRSLRRLEVPKCSLLTDSAFTTLNMASLWRLYVSETSVTGSFASHVLSETSNLRLLCCQRCSHLSSDLIHSTPAHCVKLSSLSLASANRLTESDWMQLSTKFPNMYSLQISDTPAVNDVVAQSFRNNCPKLKSVTLERCSVSEEVLKSFK